MINSEQTNKKTCDLKEQPILPHDLSPPILDKNYDNSDECIQALQQRYLNPQTSKDSIISKPFLNLFRTNDEPIIERQKTPSKTSEDNSDSKPEENIANHQIEAQISEIPQTQVPSFFETPNCLLKYTPFLDDTKFFEEKFAHYISFYGDSTEKGMKTHHKISFSVFDDTLIYLYFQIYKDEKKALFRLFNIFRRNMIILHKRYEQFISAQKIDIDNIVKMCLSNPEKSKMFGISYNKKQSTQISLIQLMDCYISTVPTKFLTELFSRKDFDRSVNFEEIEIDIGSDEIMAPMKKTPELKMKRTKKRRIQEMKEMKSIKIINEFKIKKSTSSTFSRANYLIKLNKVLSKLFGSSSRNFNSFALANYAQKGICILSKFINEELEKVLSDSEKQRLRVFSTQLENEDYE